MASSMVTPMPSASAAAMAWVALPRLALPGSLRFSGYVPSSVTAPFSTTTPSSVIRHVGSGRRNSRPSGNFFTAYQSTIPSSRVSWMIAPPVRGQLVESPAQPNPADTHTTFGLSHATDVTDTSSQFAITVISGRVSTQARSVRSILLISPTRSSWSRERFSSTSTSASSFSAMAGTCSSSTSNTTVSAVRPASSALITPASMLSPPSLVATARVVCAALASIRVVVDLPFVPVTIAVGRCAPFVPGPRLAMRFGSIAPATRPPIMPPAPRPAFREAHVAASAAAMATELRSLPNRPFVLRAWGVVFTAHDSSARPRQLPARYWLRPRRPPRRRRRPPRFPPLFLP